MSGQVGKQLPQALVARCSGIREDGSCRREQLIEMFSGGEGTRVALVSEVSDDTAQWLASYGWRFAGSCWLCPFCAPQECS